MASVSASQDDDDDAPVDGINITPLVDVLMVVLVMFILTATAQIAGISETVKGIINPESKTEEKPAGKTEEKKDKK